MDEDTRQAWLKANPGKSSPFSAASADSPRRPTVRSETSLSSEREVSSIPRSFAQLHNPTPAQQAQPIPNRGGDDDRDGKWVYPSARQFYDAMKRKQHNPDVADMDVVVPIHNAVNEQAWRQILQWERMWTHAPPGQEDTKLISFKGRPKDLTWRAWFRGVAGYQHPFDRHDWIIDRNGKQVRYIIDFYTGRPSLSPSQSPSQQQQQPASIASEFQAARTSLSFYLDVRPAPSTPEGLAMRAARLYHTFID